MLSFGSRSLRLLADASPVTLIVAPAGFGKSALTAAARHAAGDVPLVRIGFQHDSSARAQSVAGALIDAATALGAVVGSGHDAPRDGRLEPHLAERLASRLQHVPGPFMLVLDELDVVDLPDAEELGRLVGDVATPLHRVVGASREPVPWPIRSWQRSGLCTVIAAADLALEAWQVRDELGIVPGSRLDEVMAMSRGWPVAIDSLRSKLAVDPDIPIRAAISDVVDFVDDEVVASLREDVRRFLCRVSVLAQFPPTVAAVVAEEAGASALLNDLCRGSPLISRVGSSTFELHPLLREALRRRLDGLEPGSGELRHRLAAAAWLEEPASFDASVQAMDHLIAARAWPEALDLLRRFAGEPFRRSSNRLEVAWLEAIPGRYWEDDLDLAFWYAGAAALVGQGRKGYDRLSRLPIAAHPGGVAVSKISRAHTTFWSFDPVEALALAVEGDEELAALPPEVTVPRAPGFPDRIAYAALARFSVGRAHALMGRFDDCVAWMDQVLAGDGPSLATMAVSAHGTVAWALAMQGEVVRANAAARAAIALADECALAEHLAVAPAHLACAVVHDLTAQAQRARSELNRAASVARTVAAGNFLRLCDAVGSTFQPSVRVAWADISPDAHSPELPFVTRLTRAGEARRLAAIGDRARAEQLLQSVEPHELTLSAWVELGIDRAPMHQLNRWVQLRPEPTCVRGRIVRQLALAATSAQDAAMVEQTRRAADLAAAGGLVGVFLDAPRQLLDRLIARPIDHPVLAAVHDALIAARPEVHLSPRELELLAFLPGSEPAAQLAERLCVSLSTVKSHLASIYRKLGVAGRVAAVERGRELGLIPNPRAH